MVPAGRRVAVTPLRLDARAAPAQTTSMTERTLYLEHVEEQP
jgi:hypothetical protein